MAGYQPSGYRRKRRVPPPPPPRKRCSCCRMLMCLISLTLLAIVGGILLWQFLPEEHRQGIQDTLGNGLPFGFRGGDAPPPEYEFFQCTDGTRCCNGLTENCNKRVNEILYAGVHNAQSTVQDGFFIAPNHQYNVYSSLIYGFRVLNFDVGSCKGKLSLVHGKCKLGTADPVKVFQSIMDWLDAYTNEVILIPMQIDDDAGGETVDLGKLYNLLATNIDGFTDRLFEKQFDTPWPTLQNLIDFDRRIILFHYNSDVLCFQDGCPPGFHDWFLYAAETRFEFQTPQEIDDKPFACEITRGREDADLYALNVFTNIPGRTSSRDKLNKYAYLKSHIAACRQQISLQPSIVFIDFWFDSDLPRVVQEHNRNV